MTVFRGDYQTIHAHKDDMCTNADSSLEFDVYRTNNRELSVLLKSTKIHAKLEIVYGIGESLTALNALSHHFRDAASILRSPTESDWLVKSKRVFDIWKEKIDPLRNDLQRKLIDGTHATTVIKHMLLGFNTWQRIGLVATIFWVIAISVLVCIELYGNPASVFSLNYEFRFVEFNPLPIQIHLGQVDVSSHISLYQLFRIGFIPPFIVWLLAFVFLRIKTHFILLESNMKSSKTSGYFARAWNGDVRLWKIFWLNFVLFSFVFRLISTFTDSFISKTSPFVWLVFIGLWLVLIGLVIAYFIWVLTALWRCAFNSSSKVWAYLSRGLVIWSVFSFFGGILFAVITAHK